MNRRQCITLAGAAALGRIVPAAADPLARYDAALATCSGFNGTVAVGRGARILYSKAVGLADPQAGTPMALATRFEAGSVSKWIAAMVVMKLVDDGRLALDEPVTRYLPEYRADTGARLTLRHLMSHSSGVPNDIVAARKADPQVGLAPMEQMEAVRRFASGDLRFTPGTAWDYSHSNWLVVKAIVERAGGRAYRDCVSAWLLEPLRLRDSGVFSGESAAVPGMAVAYAGLAPPWQRKVTPVPDYLAMAGGFYTSAPDMLLLMDGVLGGDILGPASRAALMRVVMPGQHYALGGRTRVDTIAGVARETAWEDGANGGFRLVARCVLADGTAVVVCNNSNHDQQELALLASALMAAAYG
ncbi:MAG TPA: serine hydrolase domain-containing protein [Pseudoduganella sp.]